MSAAAENLCKGCDIRRPDALHYCHPCRKLLVWKMDLPAKLKADIAKKLPVQSPTLRLVETYPDIELPKPEPPERPNVTIRKPVSTSDSAANAIWLQRHTSDDEYAGQWVALRDGELLDYDPDRVELDQRLERDGFLTNVTFVQFADKDAPRCWHCTTRARRSDSAYCNVCIPALASTGPLQCRWCRERATRDALCGEHWLLHGKRSPNGD